MSEWISVEDELPEKGKGVLAFNNTIWVGAIDANTGVWFEMSDFESLGNVTHWMPLPDAPK